MKLHLGCGDKYMKGWINCDIKTNVNADRVMNFEEPLPFDDNSVDEIYSRQTFEHIRNIIPFMQELHRICKKGAIIHSKVPMFCCYSYWARVEHVTAFSPHTFKSGTFIDIFDTKFRINYFMEPKKGPIEVFGKIMTWFSNKYPYFYCRNLAFIFPASEIEYWLEVKK